MAHYSRKWDCKVCDTRQESIDWPSIEVCEECIDASGLIRRNQHKPLIDMIEHAYSLGYRHGKYVEARSPFPKLIEDPK